MLNFKNQKKITTLLLSLEAQMANSLEETTAKITVVYPENLTMTNILKNQLSF